MTFFDVMTHYDRLAEASLMEKLYMSEHEPITPPVIPAPLDPQPAALTPADCFVGPEETELALTQNEKDWILDGEYGAPAVQVRPSPRLDDVTDALGEWAGLIMGQTDDILAGLNDGDWKGDSRQIVLDHVGRVIVDLFAEGEHLKLYDADIGALDRIATRHLAEFVVIKSLADRKRLDQKRAAVEMQI